MEIVGKCCALRVARRPIVLLIDDNDALRQIIADYLHADGLCVQHAGDVQNGLDLYADHTYSAVILDISVRHSDGVDVLQAIRRRSNVPVICISANSREQARCLRAGSSYFIAKPFKMHELSALASSVSDIRKPANKAVSLRGRRFAATDAACS